MSSIFDAMPGLEVPVGEITGRLAALWIDSAADGRPAPEAGDALATQLNFVLHFGMNATPDDAAHQFQSVLNMSRRHPSRVIVLCPLHADVPEPEMRAKIYGECFLGRAKADKRCVEFVILSYSRSARGFLENEVSVCLSADLPVYYWPHRFAESAKLLDYQYLLTRAKRVLIDSATAPADARTHTWPNPKAMRDLAYCRLLPVRQGIGQFLAAYPPATLVGGLRRVTVEHAPALAAEGRQLAAWLRDRMVACGAAADAFQLESVPPAPVQPGSLAVRFAYPDGGRFFRWSGDFATGNAEFEADFGSGITRLPAATSLLAPEAALSEAMFF